MRRLTLSTLALLAIACSDNSGPQGKDPTVQMINGSIDGPVTLVWWDQSGQQGSWTAKAGETVCAKFIATTPTDSVRFLAWAGDTTGGNWSKSWSPWFDPITGLPGAAASAYPDGAEYWVLRVTSWPEFTMGPVATPPCQ